MRRCFLSILFLLILTPGLAIAEYEPPEHRWTIGYEDGITLRRFLGENWEVYLGGGPNDQIYEYESTIFQYPDDDIPTHYSDYEDINKSESGFVHLGVGRRLLSEKRFWLTAFINVNYNWNNYQTKYKRDYIESGEYRMQERVGHAMSTTVSLGLRPAFDITSRITLVVDFGIYFRHSTETWDETSQYYNNNWSMETERVTKTNDTVRMFGYRDIESIGLLFRF